MWPDRVTIEAWSATPIGQPNHVPAHIEHTNALDYGKVLGAKLLPGLAID